MGDKEWKEKKSSQNPRDITGSMETFTVGPWGKITKKTKSVKMIFN